MKSQKTNDGRKSMRWKWMAGATAATAAGATTSGASLITVNLTNNYISSSQGNHQNADLTGDGHPDLMISRANAFSSTYLHSGTSNYIFVHAIARAYLNGVQARARIYGDFGFHGVQLGSQGNSYGYLTGSIPIFFKDLHINSGARTRGSLEVTVSAFGNISPNADAEIQLDSFTYDSASSVPDQGSSLALLAMGAGGILAFRRWRATQQR